MIYHSLICMLQDPQFLTNSKTLRVNMDPNIDKIREVYSYNLRSLNNLIIYCKNHNILSLRISSSLFPLLSHAKYEENCWKVLKELLPQFQFDEYIHTIELSSHPDQFILLSSTNPGVNELSIKELETYAYISQYIPLKLVNIHVGSAAMGVEHHGAIFLENFKKLSPTLQNLLSLENDEKSYSFLDTLAIAQKAGCMVVADFHHNRCFHRRKQEYSAALSFADMDAHIYDNIDHILKLYEKKAAYPTFHLSSPKGGWCGAFKEECAHSDYIDITDYPTPLIELSKDKIFILDIEAKAKEQALFHLKQNHLPYRFLEKSSSLVSREKDNGVACQIDVVKENHTTNVAVKTSKIKTSAKKPQHNKKTKAKRATKNDK